MLLVGAILGTVTENHITKEQLKTFQDKVKQYVIHEFDNTRDIIIFVQDLKDTYVKVDTDKTINLSKEEK